MTDTPEILRTVETRTSRYELRADGIVFQRVLTTSTQTLADARENTAAYDTLVEGRKHPLIVDMRANFATERGVREHYASAEGAGRCSAIALLISSTAGRMIGNFFLALQTSAVPTRMFAEEADALAWVRRLGARR
jgi:hypothetical protein